MDERSKFLCCLNYDLNVSYLISVIFKRLFVLGAEQMNCFGILKPLL